MVIVQRIVVEWTKEERGAEQAALRSHVPSAMELPPMPDAALAVHEVLAEGRTGYLPVETTAEHSLPRQLLGLRFALSGDGVLVSRTSAHDAHPQLRRPHQLFLLRPGERARYQANFRYSSSRTQWYYTEWQVNMAYAPWRRDLFVDSDLVFDYEKDERVSLYGGPR
ncbi:hypothetical protein EDD27_3930 [Nonomuraea polychroma]|uniref:Uncharacterized protein n=1 Tax=Nonomuraea polychroma TaxID=46176 RepID=A0A438M6R4_9ACTN|nr:hypothetical protein [Nonomuraea polychroma]RVX41403.1 hypothetical protein EDD27_3930 [Nonomuraea polychroma]